MRKSSYIILLLNLVSIVFGMYILRNSEVLFTNYAIDNSNHIMLSKENLILIGLVPFLVVFAMDIIATVEADEIKPFIRYYDRMKFTLCFGFQSIYILIVTSQIIAINEKHIIGLILFLVTMYIGYLVPKISMNQIFGIINKWTKDDKVVWSKVHKRAGLLLQFFSLLVILITFIIDVKMVIIASSIAVILLIYIYYYSYKCDLIEKGKNEN